MLAWSARTKTATRSCARASRVKVPVAPGELVGEIAVLDGGPRTATVVAEGPVRVLEIGREDLMRVLEADPKAATALIAVLASLFRESA
jgi:CRP-like cAMP-binding protein